MRFSNLEDFVVFARYMNITRAAAELHMTQSNLSKRIKQIEAEVGCELVSHGEQLGLTPAGLLFLDKASVLLDDYNKLLEKVRSANASELGPLLIRTPTWPDAGAAGAICLANSFREKYPNIPVQFVFRQYQRPMEMIDQGTVDAHIVYEYGELPAIVDYYRGKGFFAHPICTDRLAVWCHADSAFAEKGAVGIDDLCGAPVLQITQLYKPLERAITEMCSAHGFKPRFVEKTMNSFQEMLVVTEPASVHVFPFSLRDDIQLKSCANMRLLPVEGEAQMHAVLILREESSKTTVELFRSFLKTM